MPASVPVKPGCGLQICARLRSVLLVAVCLTVFGVILGHRENNREPSDNKSVKLCKKWLVHKTDSHLLLGLCARQLFVLAFGASPAILASRSRFSTPINKLI